MIFVIKTNISVNIPLSQQNIYTEIFNGRYLRPLDYYWWGCPAFPHFIKWLIMLNPIIFT